MGVSLCFNTSLLLHYVLLLTISGVHFIFQSKILVNIYKCMSYASYMAILKWFIKLMKHEHNDATIRRHEWVLDESKCMTSEETDRLLQ